MVIKILNLDKCIKKFDDISRINLMPEITKSAIKVQRSARDIVPVDTGLLKASIARKNLPQEQAAIVYTVVEYAPYVEFGTRYQVAQPFMSPALEMNKKSIQASMRSFIRQELRKSAI